MGQGLSVSIGDGEHRDLQEPAKQLSLVAILVLYRYHSGRQDVGITGTPSDVTAHLFPLLVASAIETPRLEVDEHRVAQGPALAGSVSAVAAIDNAVRQFFPMPLVRTSSRRDLAPRRVVLNLPPLVWRTMRAPVGRFTSSTFKAKNSEARQPLFSKASWMALSRTSRKDLDLQVASIAFTWGSGTGSRGSCFRSGVLMRSMGLVSMTSSSTTQRRKVLSTRTARARRLG